MMFDKSRKIKQIQSAKIAYNKIENTFVQFRSVIDRFFSTGRNFNSTQIGFDRQE